MTFMFVLVTLCKPPSPLSPSHTLHPNCHHSLPHLHTLPTHCHPSSTHPSHCHHSLPYSPRKLSPLPPHTLHTLPSTLSPLLPILSPHIVTPPHTHTHTHRYYQLLQIRIPSDVSQQFLNTIILATSLNVTGLHPHYTHTFAVTAVTIRPGPYSEPQAITTPEDCKFLFLTFNYNNSNVL